MTYQCYFKSKDGNAWVSANFKIKEFACKDGTDVIWVTEELVEVLQTIRNHFGKPVIINSAYRTPEHNEKVGGTKYSHHMLGEAADIRVKDVSSKEVARYASSIMEYGGVICYTNFTHIDVRENEKYRKGV